MTKPLISATIIARNEEQKIEACLKSLSGTVSEIILIHDGKCEDATLKIARKYTSNVHQRRYVGEAEPHRRAAFSVARNNWILQIDADEFLTPKLAELIPSLIKDKSVSGYRVKWNVSYTDEKPRYNKKLILYRRDRIREFLGIPHEVVSLDGRIIDLYDLELGHNRTRSKAKTLHDTKEWPQIQGEYLEKHKFQKLPTILLPLGHIFYPLFGTIISLFRGTISVREIPACLDYHSRLWASFLAHRLRRTGGKR